MLILERIYKFLVDVFTKPIVVDSSTPIDVNIPTPVDVNITTPLDVNVTNPVVIDDSTPINVSVAGAITANLTLPLDAAGSLRVSQKTITGLYTQRHGLDANVERVTNAGASVTHAADYAAARMRITASGGYAIAKTYQSHPYITGRSSLYEFTTINFQIESGATKRRGAFTTSNVAPYTANVNGFYVEANGLTNTYNVVLGNGSSLVTLTRDTHWYDKLDGTGPSGKTVNFENFTIFRVDFLWLGGKGILFEVCIDNEFVPFVAYAHANNVKGLIFKSPMLPLRSEIRAEANFVSAVEMYDVCCTHAVEGSLDIKGRTGCVRTNPTTPSSFPNAGTRYAAMVFRFGSAFDDAIIDFLNCIITSSSNDDLAFEWVLNPTIANANTLVYAAAPSTDNLEYAIGGPTHTVTNGVSLSGGLMRQSTAYYQLVDNLRRIGIKLDGTSETMALVITPASASATATIHVNYFEL